MSPLTQAGSDPECPPPTCARAGPVLYRNADWRRHHLKPVLFQTSNVFIGLLGERYGYNPANTDTHHALVESLHAAAAEFPPVGAQMSARSCLAVGRCPPRLSSKHSAEDLAACQRPTALGAATLPVCPGTP